MKKLYWLCLLLLSARLLSAQAPVAAPDTATILQFGTVTIHALANDSNTHAGDTLFIHGIIGAPAGWAVLPASDTTIVFHARDSDFTGIDTFYYQVCDRHDTTLCDTGTVIITINRLVPLAVTDTVSLLQFDTLVISPLVNDTNYHAGDSLCVKSLYGGPFGWGLIPDCHHIVFHALDSSFSGLDTLYYRVCDIVIPTLCDTGMIIVNVKRVVPLALPDSVGMSQPGSVTIHALANDTNFHFGDTLCINAVWDTISGWVTIQGCGDIVYHPLDPNFEGLDTFYYSSCDIHATSLCDTGMVVVYVYPLPTTAAFSHTDSMCGITLIDLSPHDDLPIWQINGLTSGINEGFSYEDTVVIDWTTGFVPDVYVICLTANNSTNSSTLCDTISTGCIGIREIPSANIRIYPNPATDEVRIDLSGAGASATSELTAIELYDMVGQKLKSIPASTANTIAVSDLSSGVYLIVSVDKNNAHRVMGKCEVMR